MVCPLTLSIVFDQRSGVPKYVVLAKYLRDRIKSGELAPGAKVPSESALMSISGYGRDVARKAIGILQHEGLVVTDQGKPTRVREVPPKTNPLDLVPGAEVTVRMPSEEERLARSMDFGVPLIEVHYEGATELHSADGRVIRYRDGGELDDEE